MNSMNKNNAILVTGATGFLGTELTARLLSKTDQIIYVLIRAKSEKAALHRLKSVWYGMTDLYQNIDHRIYPVPGDFTKPDLGLSADRRQQLTEEVSLIFHCGAQVGLQSEEQELIHTNILRQQNNEKE